MATTERPTGPVRAGSRRRYEERRDAVIDAAAGVFARQGYDATTIDDLVAATGLQRGGLYHYIGGKQDLLIAIHERFLTPLLETAREIAAQELEPEAALRALAHALIENIHRYRDQVTVFFHEWRTIEGDERWTEVRRERREFESIIADVLERGRAAGKFEFSDTRIALLGFLGMINYMPQWYEPRGRMGHSAIADQFCDIFLRGIAAPGPATTGPQGDRSPSRTRR
jgi:TetR/AcrR family transcriptional regulator, cholesterol catabolism regulator